MTLEGLELMRREDTSKMCMLSFIDFLGALGLFLLRSRFLLPRVNELSNMLLLCAFSRTVPHLFVEVAE